MKMVSANKLRKAQVAQRRAIEFTDRLTALLGTIAPAPASDAHPLLTPRPVSTVHLLVLTSDRGLCGGFNHSINRLSAEWVQQRAAEGRRVLVSFYGRRGFQYGRGKFPVRKYYEGPSGLPLFDSVRRIALDLQTAFLGGTYDEVYLAYNSFVSALTQKPRVERLLPVALRDTPRGQTEPGERILEPGLPAVLDLLLPQLVAAQLYLATLNSAAGEHGARMTAMDNSTSNADSLIEKYTLMRNRARQSAITRELSEIIAGAEALA
jgi:F-type H+-transporting ATPase subunit gamma